jgi:cholesterol oxidase
VQGLPCDSVRHPDERRGARDGRTSGTRLIARLTITIDDLDRFLADARHAASIDGWIDCDALGGELPIESGVFNLFAEEADPTRKHMRYRLFFRDSVGHAVTLMGVKVVRNNMPIAVWPETSTLYRRLVRGHINAEQEARAELVAAGILRLSLPGVLRQLTTFRAEAPSRTARAAAIIAFITFFCTANSRNSCDEFRNCCARLSCIAMHFSGFQP